MPYVKASAFFRPLHSDREFTKLSQQDEQI